MGYISVTDHLANIHKAVGSIPDAGEKRKERKRKKDWIAKTKTIYSAKSKGFQKAENRHGGALPCLPISHSSKNDHLVTSKPTGTVSGF